MRTLVIVYGTRPEFLKIRALIEKCRAATIPLKVIRVNQHASFHDDAGYFDHQVDIIDGDNRMASIGTSILHDLPPLLGDAVVLVQGDTATAFYAALAAFQAGAPIVHLEAGMRTYDLRNPFPEEGYRQMISRIAAVHLCPSHREAEALSQEGTPKSQVHVVGNTILDLVASYGVAVHQGNHVIITLHRRENWASYSDYIRGLAALASRAPHLTFEFYTHPNPALKALIAAITMPPNFIVCEPLGHRALVERLATCAFVITDSGGIQEEANFLGKHMYVLRRCTERSAIGAEKIALIPEPSNISTINCAVNQGAPGHEYGDGDSCTAIIRILRQFLA